jgi:hypothetical protein
MRRGFGKWRHLRIQERVNKSVVVIVTYTEREKWKDGKTIQSHQELENNNNLFWYTDTSKTYPYRMAYHRRRSIEGSGVPEG